MEKRETSKDLPWIYDLGGKKNFEQVFGNNWLYCLLPSASMMGDGLHFPINPAAISGSSSSGSNINNSNQKRPEINNNSDESMNFVLNSKYDDDDEEEEEEEDEGDDVDDDDDEQVEDQGRSHYRSSRRKDFV